MRVRPHNYNGYRRGVVAVLHPLLIASLGSLTYMPGVQQVVWIIRVKFKLGIHHTYVINPHGPAVTMNDEHVRSVTRAYKIHLEDF